MLLGIQEANGRALRYVGGVGTGFIDAELARLQKRLARSIRKTSPFSDLPVADSSDANLGTPALVGEVEFAEWTGENRGEGRLRHSSWRGVRPDKAATDVVVE